MFKNNLFFLSLAVAVILLGACSGDIKKPAEIREKPVAVTLTKITAGEQPFFLASGEVESVQTANISTRVMGRITHIFVNTGDKVRRGHLLATIWDEDIKAKRAQTDAAVAEAEAALATAQKDYDRFNHLYKEQSATAKELDNATLQYQTAKAGLSAAGQMRNEINASLSYNNLTAPFDGVVTQKLAETGSIVNPGMPVFTLEQNGILQVSAKVSESDIAGIHLGDVANVQIKSTGRLFDGRIIQINPSSQFTGGEYIIKVSIPETARAAIYAGMFANIRIPVKNAQQPSTEDVMVPLSAIIHRDELTGIYTVSAENTAQLRWIRLGKISNDKAIVISGLSRDEKFISSSESKLYNGIPVEVKDSPGITAVTNRKKSF
jgi:RND family efflux transporter MFP subunit